MNLTNFNKHRVGIGGEIYRNTSNKPPGAYLTKLILGMGAYSKGEGIFLGGGGFLTNV